MKNKNVLIIVGVIVLLLGLGTVFVLNRSTEPEEVETEFVDEVIKLKPEDIGLQMEANDAQNKVKFIINKPQGIESLEYELSYEADVPPGYVGEEETVSRGIAGEEEIEPGAKKFESKFLDLGSASSGVFRPDIGVEEVHLLLKLNKTDGKVYQVEDSLKINQ